MKAPHFSLHTAFSFLLLAILACRPVITVGWQEIGILFLLSLVLVGPVLFRLYKRVEAFQNWKRRNDESKEQ